MAMKKTHDAVYAGEKYTDREGNEKTRYVNVGALFVRDDGSMTAKIEAIPVNFSGWLNFYEPKPRDGEQPQRQERPARSVASAGGGPVRPAPTDGFEDEDLPF